MTTHQNPKRRTIAAGAAWSVPVIVAAAAAPASARSGTPPTFRFLSACKSPGNSCKVFPKGYEFRFEVCNTSGVDIWVHAVTYENYVGDTLDLVHATPALPFKIAPSGCRNVVFRASNTNSANSVFTADMRVVWDHNQLADQDGFSHPDVIVKVVVTGTPPDCACAATPDP